MERCYLLCLLLKTLKAKMRLCYNNTLFKWQALGVFLYVHPFLLEVSNNECISVLKLSQSTQIKYLDLDMKSKPQTFRLLQWIYFSAITEATLHLQYNFPLFQCLWGLVSECPEG